jgi:hypothetical protein
MPARCETVTQIMLFAVCRHRRFRVDGKRPLAERPLSITPHAASALRRMAAGGTLGRASAPARIVRRSALMSGPPSVDDLRRDVRRSGLAWRGAFHPAAEDGVPALAGRGAVATLVLLGFVGGEQWPVFSASTELADGLADPLDRWSRRIVAALAARHGASAFYPSDGPPWLPFQRWAMRAESVHPSPLGILIHPDYGLWHAYRGALAFRERIDLPAADRRPSPCPACATRPCERTCPVAAVTSSGYDAAACTAHVAAAAGVDCLQQGCRARRACPVGATQRYGVEQAEFHMRSFLRRS